jgi:hypothetical protein
VSLPAAKRDGRLGRGAAIAAALGLAVFGLSVGVFAVAKLVNPGLWHVITAAALLVLFVTRGLTRILYLAGLAILMATQAAIHQVIYKPDDYAHIDPANKILILVYLALILAAAGVQIVSSGRGAQGAGPATKAFAYLAILVWVTTAAAGRWIAFA